MNRGMLVAGILVLLIVAFISGYVFWNSSQVEFSPNPRLGEVKIMFLGDSITEMTGASSYRYWTWKKLNDNGRLTNVNFVGSRRDSDPTYGGYDADNEGHAGCDTAQILIGYSGSYAYCHMYQGESIQNWAWSYNPDIVVIHLGINNYHHYANSNNIDVVRQVAIIQLGQIIDVIRAVNPNTVFFVAEVIPSKLAVSGNLLLSFTAIAQFNTDIINTIGAKGTSQSPVYIVDMFSGFNWDTMSDDGVHPNQLGAQLMADRLSYSLINYWNLFPVCNYNGQCDSGEDRSSCASDCPAVCTNFTYSSWGNCPASGIQVRSILTKSPSGCSGGSPITSQNCTYIPPCAESNWQYSDEICQSDNQKIRNWTQIGTCNQTNGVAHPLTENVSCIYQAPNCTYYYSNWSNCSSTRVQTREYTSSPSLCTGSPITSQECDYVQEPINGECGSTKNNCYRGDYIGQTDNSTNYLWKCSGLYGGANASCSIKIPLNIPQNNTANFTMNNSNNSYVVNSSINNSNNTSNFTMNNSNNSYVVNSSINSTIKNNSIVCKNGCLSIKTCYPVGSILGNRYCSDKNLKFRDQKDIGFSCNANYECKSKYCVSHLCKDQSWMQGVLNWFKGLFGIK
jgi:hypothetical protein